MGQYRDYRKEAPHFTNPGQMAHSKRGCVFAMVIWPEFRMVQYRVNDHPYHTPQYILFVINRIYLMPFCIFFIEIHVKYFYQKLRI